MSDSSSIRQSDRSGDSTALYLPVPIYLYENNEIIEHPLYFKYDGKFIVFQDSGRPWVQDDVQKLKNFGVTELYLKVENETDWQSFMEQKMDRFMTKPDLPSSEKAKIIYQTAASSTDSFFKNPNSAEAAKKSVVFVKHCVDYLMKDQEAFYEIFQSSTQNLQEQTHGIHCAAYSVTLAKQLGHNSEKDLLALGIGAMLHDIGKLKISKAILDKAGPLDESEWIEIRKHPRYGVEMVQKFHSLVPELSRRIILEHHERSDGSGYPKALTSQIHVFSRIVAIADVFDSMTSHRPYKKQSPSFQTMLELLSTQMGRLDRDLLVAFIEMMKK